VTHFVFDVETRFSAAKAATVKLTAVEKSIRNSGTRSKLMVFWPAKEKNFDNKTLSAKKANEIMHIEIAIFSVNERLVNCCCTPHPQFIAHIIF
jgi:hypothetical protein